MALPAAVPLFATGPLGWRRKWKCVVEFVAQFRELGGVQGAGIVPEWRTSTANQQQNQPGRGGQRQGGQQEQQQPGKGGQQQGGGGHHSPGSSSRVRVASKDATISASFGGGFSMCIDQGAIEMSAHIDPVQPVKEGFAFNIKDEKGEQWVAI